MMLPIQLKMFAFVGLLSLNVSHASASVLLMQIKEGDRIRQERVFDLTGPSEITRLRHGDQDKVALEIEDGRVACGAFLNSNLEGPALLTSLNLSSKKSSSNSNTLSLINSRTLTATDLETGRICVLEIKHK